MYFEIYNIVFEFLFGSVSASNLTTFQLFLTEFVCYGLTLFAVLLPVAFVYYLFKFIARMIQWN